MIDLLLMDALFYNVFIIYMYLLNINKAAYYLESSACGELQLFYRSLPLRSCNVLETLFKCIFLL